MSLLSFPGARYISRRATKRLRFPAFYALATWLPFVPSLPLPRSHPDPSHPLSLPSLTASLRPSPRAFSSICNSRLVLMTRVGSSSSRRGRRSPRDSLFARDSVPTTANHRYHRHHSLSHVAILYSVYSIVAVTFRHFFRIISLI